MLQNFTLHTHTNEFDGKNTVAEMVNAAYEHGMKTIGISNHFIVHPNIKQTNFYPHAVIGGYDGMYNDNFDTVTKKFKKHFSNRKKYDIVVRAHHTDIPEPDVRFYL